MPWHLHLTWTDFQPAGQVMCDGIVLHILVQAWSGKLHVAFAKMRSPCSCFTSELYFRLHFSEDIPTKTNYQVAQKGAIWTRLLGRPQTQMSQTQMSPANGRLNTTKGGICKGEGWGWKEGGMGGKGDIFLLI